MIVLTPNSGVCVTDMQVAGTRTSSEVLSVDGTVDGDATSTVVSTNQTSVVLLACTTDHAVTTYLLRTPNVHHHAPASQSL